MQQMTEELEYFGLTVLSQHCEATSLFWCHCLTVARESVLLSVFEKNHGSNPDKLRNPSKWIN